MKESLKLLGVSSAGFDEIDPSLKNLNDDDVINETNKINELSKKIDYLKNFLEKSPVGYIKSKRYLAELLKSKDPQYACDLILSVSRFAPVDPVNYLIFAEIAMEHNAWVVAKSACEVAKWLCFEEKGEKIKTYLDAINQKIALKEEDNSSNEFWKNKLLAKFWILERLCYRSSDPSSVIKYSFKLLDTFGDNEENYDCVSRVFSLVNNKETINKFVEYINKKLVNHQNLKNLYLGICFYNLSDYDKSLQCLENLVKVDPRNIKALFYLGLNYLMINNIKNFISTYEKIIPVVDPTYIALHFISSAFSAYDLGSAEFPNQKAISREVSVLVEKLLINKHDKTVQHLLEQFKKLNYYLILPYLNLYLSEIYIKRNQIETAKELIKDSKDFETHRLYAWIYRLEGKDNLAEEELIKYRKYWIPNKEIGLSCKSISLNLPDEAPKNIDSVMNVVNNAYEETKTLVRNIDLEYGLNASTCMETACQDCCTKTFPYISYTEYLYLKNWLETQSKELMEEIKERSLKVVNLYKERYKKDPPFLTDRGIDSRKEYPYELTFDCPNLGDNKCNVYEARPFTCRAYSYGTQEGVTYKGCTYFYEQLKGATKLYDVRKVIDMQSFFNFLKNCDEQLIGKGIVAPIPVWFAQSYEETLAKIKEQFGGLVK